MQKTAMEEDRKRDGGCLGWTIVLASFMVSFIQQGFSTSIGLLLPFIVSHFKASVLEAGLTGSIMTCLMLGVGPLVASLIQRWGHTTTSLLGSLLATLGLMSAGLYIHHLEGTNLVVLYLTVGGLTGLGLGLLYLPAHEILQHHFSQRLGLALGLASSGSGLGQLALAPLLQLKLSKLGLGVALYCLAGLLALTAGPALLYSPSSGHQTPEIIAEKPHAKKQKSTRQTYKDLLGSSAIRLLLLSHLLVSMGIFSNFHYMADHVVQHGMEAANASLLLSVTGGANFIGRVVFGLLLDRFRSKTIFLTSLALLANALSFFLQEFFLSFSSQAVLAGLFGLTFGAKSSSTVLIIRMVTEDVTTALGLCFLVFSVSSLLGVTVTGVLFDQTGDYGLGLLVLSLLAGLGAALLGPLAYLQGRPQKKPAIEKDISNMGAVRQLKKNPAYGRHQLSRPMRIEGPIQI